MDNRNFNSLLIHLILSLIVFISGCVNFVSDKYSNEASIKSGDYFYEFRFTDKKPNVKEGQEYYYFQNQQINNTKGYVGNKPLDGEFKAYYYDNQQVAQVGNFHNGLKDGQWNFYSKDGSLNRTEYWRKGDLKDKEDFDDDIEELSEEINPNDTSKTKFPKLKNLFKDLFKKDSTSME